VTPETLPPSKRFVRPCTIDNISGSAPPAVTLKAAVVPTTLVRLRGSRVMKGGKGETPAYLIVTMSELPPVPAEAPIT